jgi:hypothetical protein
MASERILVGVVMCLVVALGARTAAADIDGDSYTSETYGVRATLPRGWRITESSGYPRTLLWMSRSKPRVRIAITVDPIASDCRTGATFCNPDPAAVALALGSQLSGAGFTVQSNSSQSRTPTLEYAIGGAHLRHAIVVVNSQVVSVILAADSASDLASVTRTFDRLVQSIRPLASPR